MTEAAFNFSVHVEIVAQEPEMLAYNFPCGESQCWTESQFEIRITKGNADFRMPLCAKHALLLTDE